MNIVLTFFLDGLASPVVSLVDLHALVHGHIGRILRLLLPASSFECGRASLSDVALVFSVSELLLEPVDHVLERIVVLVVEEVASWLDLNELSNHILLWNISQYNILWILVEDGKSVRDLGVVFRFLHLD